MILPVIFITKSKLSKPRVYKRQFTVAQDALTELLLAILFHFWFVITYCFSTLAEYVLICVL